METVIYRQIRRTSFEVLQFGISALTSTVFLTLMVRDSFRSGGFTEAWSHQPLFMLAATLIVLIFFADAVLHLFFYPRLRTRNFLQLDDAGLEYGRRQWRWNELSAFNKPQGRWFGRNIVFAIPGQANWLIRFEAANLGLPEGPLARIWDIYDTPLEEIVATLNEYRERALGGANGLRTPEQA